MNDSSTDLGRLLHRETLGGHRAAVDALTAEWRTGDNVRRLWRRDATLWSGKDEALWLGWLDIVAQQAAHAEVFADVVRKVTERKPAHVVLLGMGGSSLCPDVLAHTFGRQEGAPELLVLDSTDPAQVATLAERVDAAQALFVVASKSGSTAEPNAFKAFFYDRVVQAVGQGKAGQHFVAITDPGSSLDQLAKEEGFLATYAGVPSIGGRYSALSLFGMVPAAAMGLDAHDLLARAGRMVRACGADVPPESNPGVRLGLVIGALAQAGR
ncbi:MAG: transaldolase, partial [Myxococcota bacterium]